MRLLFAFLLLPAILLAYDFRIDHITVAGVSIQSMQEALSKIGISSVYGGPHTDRVTEMALVSFPDGSYLEFIGLQKAAPPALIDHHVWAKYLRENAGPAAWALREDDLARPVDRFRQAGVPVSPPQRNGRQRPDGVRLEWETATLGTEPRGTFFPFLIHDFTPREQRAFPQGKPVSTEFRGVAAIVIGVRNLEASVARYRKAFELPGPAIEADREFGARLASFPGSPVVLAQPLANGAWLAKRLDQFGEIPCAFVLQRAAGPKRSRPTWFDAGVLGWRLGAE